MSEDNWFYEEDGKQEGPVSAEDLKAKIETGVLSRSNLVWKEGLPEWIAASSTELIGKADKPPPQTPPISPPPQSPAATPPPQPNVFVPRKSQLNPNYTFRIGEVLGRAWNLMTSDFWPMVGFFALAFIIYNVAANLVVPVLFMYYPIMGGYMYYTLKRLRGEPADIESIFDGFRRKFGSLSILTLFLMIPLFAIIMFTVIVFSVAMPLAIQTGNGDPIIITAVTVLTLALMILPISILSIVTCLAALLCLDCDYDWKYSLGQSWRAFKKYPLKLTIVSLLFGILTQLGMLALFVGIFVTGAWITIGYSCLYQRMFDENPD